MKVVITHDKESNRYTADLVNMPGSPRIGRGRSIYGALGDLVAGQTEDKGEILITKIEYPKGNKRWRDH